MIVLTENEGNGLKMLKALTADWANGPHWNPPIPDHLAQSGGTSAAAIDAIDSKSVQVHWDKMIGLFIQILVVLNLDPTSMSFSQGLTESKSSTIKKMQTTATKQNTQPSQPKSNSSERDFSHLTEPN